LLQEKFGASERFTCNVVGLQRSTNRRPLKCETPLDPDKWLRTHLCKWAGISRNSRKGYRRAWADLRADGHVVNRKKVQRIWREEGLRVARKPRRKRGGTSTCPITDADAPNVVWAIDFQFDSLRCGTPVKLASMVNEHTRESLLDITDRSITAEKVIDYMKKIIAKRGLPKVLRCDNGPEFISHALGKFAEEKLGIHYIPPGQPWRNGYVESFNSRVRDECLNMNSFDHIYEARAIITDWKQDYNQYHRHSKLNYLTPNEYAQKCKCIHNSKTLK
jgi:putative transposase